MAEQTADQTASFGVAGYRCRSGSPLDRAALVQTIQRTYAELFPGCPVAHLSQTVEQYLSRDTPLWWVHVQDQGAPTDAERPEVIGCLWLGNAIDQVNADRLAHIFLLYVAPRHRRRGLGKALMLQAEAWARARGDRKIGLQVFAHNAAAIELYQSLGYGVQSLTLEKKLLGNPIRPQGDTPSSPYS
jgi:ribosomal protein S18 acetylase RimI-like enzyme